MKLNSKLVIIYEFTDQNTNYLQKTASVSILLNLFEKCQFEIMRENVGIKAVIKFFGLFDELILYLLPPTLKLIYLQLFHQTHSK